MKTKKFNQVQIVDLSELADKSIRICEPIA